MLSVLKPNYFNGGRTAAEIAQNRGSRMSRACAEITILCLFVRFIVVSLSGSLMIFNILLAGFPTWRGSCREASIAAPLLEPRRAARLLPGHGASPTRGSGVAVS